MTNDGHQGNGPGRKADHHQANNQVQQTHLRQETVYTEHPRPPSRSHKDADGGGGTGRRSDTKQSDTGNLRSTNQGLFPPLFSGRNHRHPPTDQAANLSAVKIFLLLLATIRKFFGI